MNMQISDFSNDLFGLTDGCAFLAGGGIGGSGASLPVNTARSQT